MCFAIYLFPEGSVSYYYSSLANPEMEDHAKRELQHVPMQKSLYKFP